LSQIVLTQKRFWPKSFAKRAGFTKKNISIKKVMYAIFFITQGSAVQIAVFKDKPVNAKFYKTIFSEIYVRNRRPAAAGLANV
jgi:hypothetical protein